MTLAALEGKGKTVLRVSLPMPDQSEGLKTDLDADVIASLLALAGDGR